MINKTLLITGGVGYIGSHAVLAFRKAGYSILVLDNLSTDRRAEDDLQFIQGDVGNRATLDKLITKHKIAAVVHFAGSIIVRESMSNPLEYYRNNTCASRTLIEACIDHNIQHFIFSSTAAVYGISSMLPIPESAPTVPISPYGTSKLMTEWILRDTAAAHDFSYIALRYFNVTGADPQGRSRQNSKTATNLIEMAIQTAVGLHSHLEIFGDDYDTPDGTCIRDYIHVSDLVAAHVLALRYLERGGAPSVFNLGNQRGFSVREVVNVVHRVTGHDLPVRMAPRRIGDPVCIIADTSAAQRILNWKPQYTDLEVQIADAWQMQKSKQ